MLIKNLVAPYAKYVPEMVLFMASGVAAIIWACTQPINFYPDSEQYYKAARAIMGHNDGDIYYYRTWGYSIALILSGVPGYKTFSGILALQAACGAAMPLVIYLSMTPFGRVTAFCAATISFLSFSTLTWQNVIMTDQIAMFMMYVMILGGVMFATKKSLHFSIFMTIAGFLLYLLRPAAALEYFCILIVLLCLEFKQWKNLLWGAGLFLLLTFIFSKYQEHETNRFFKRSHKDSTFARGSMSGRMFFFNVYAVGPKIIGAKTVDPKNGPATQKLHDVLTAWAKQYPQGAFDYIKTKTPDEYANYLFNKADLYSHSLMWLAMDENLTAKKADIVFAKAGYEALLAHPKVLVLYYQGIIEFFFMGDVVYNTGDRVAWDEASISTALLSSYLSTDPKFPPHLLSQLSARQDANKPRYSSEMWFIEWMFYWQTALKITAVCLAIITIIFSSLWSRESACFACICVILLLYQASTAVVFAAPHYRYISPIIPLIIMLASLGVTAFVRLWPSMRRWSFHSTPVERAPL